MVCHRSWTPPVNAFGAIASYVNIPRKIRDTSASGMMDVLKPSPLRIGRVERYAWRPTAANHQPVGRSRRLVRRDRAPGARRQSTMWSANLGEAGKGWPGADHRQTRAEGLTKRRGGALRAARPEAGPMTDEIIVQGRGRDQCTSWRVRHDGTHYYVERGRVRRHRARQSGG
jgi:hypothetical protein